MSYIVDIKGFMIFIKLFMFRGCLCLYLYFFIDIILNYFIKKKKWKDFIDLGVWFNDGIIVCYV